MDAMSAQIEFYYTIGYRALKIISVAILSAIFKVKFSSESIYWGVASHMFSLPHHNGQ